MTSWLNACYSVANAPKVGSGLSGHLLEPEGACKDEWHREAAADGVAPRVQSGEGEPPKLTLLARMLGAVRRRRVHPYRSDFQWQSVMQQVIAQRAWCLVPAQAQAMQGAATLRIVLLESPTADIHACLLRCEHEDETEAFEKAQVIKQVLPLAVFREIVNTV